MYHRCRIDLIFQPPSVISCSISSAYPLTSTFPSFHVFFKSIPKPAASYLLWPSDTRHDLISVEDHMINDTSMSSS